jgi:hypothetical protein
MNLRPNLTYANVAATIALVLAVGGGTVYAASHLGKNDVKSRNLAPGAVKTSDLGKSAVTSPKIKNGTIKSVDITPGLIRNPTADVTGSATAGPQSGLNTNTTTPLVLNGTTTFTPQAGQISAITAEAQFTYASINSATPCAPQVSLEVDGQRTRIFMTPNQDTAIFPTTPTTENEYDADGPFGLVNPGTPQTITAQMRGDPGCTPDTRIDSVVVRIVQLH